MKILVDLTKKSLSILENQRSVFRGEYGADKLQLYINRELENEYPTITALLSNGRKIGPYSADNFTPETDKGTTYTRADFTLSKENGFTLSEGKMQITIWMNSDGKKEAIGNVILNVINTTAFDDGDIIISGDVAGTLVNYRVELENLQSQINNVGVKIPVIETNLNKLEKYVDTDFFNLNKDNVVAGDTNFYGSVNIEQSGYFQAPVESTSINGTPTEEWQIVNKKHLDKQLEFKVNVDVFQFEKQAISNSLNKKADTIYVDAEISHTMTYVDVKFNQILGEGASETLDTIGEISKALEENIDVVEALDNAITNKADKKEITRLDNILSELNIYDYLVYNNPEVKGNTLYLDNAYVSDGVLYLKNAKVENGVLYIDYIE